MTELLQELCDLQIENEKIVRKASFLEFDDIIKIGALFFTANKRTADPEAYLNEILAIYKKLAEGTILPGEIIAMTAMLIYDRCGSTNVDSVIAAVREAYTKIKQKHRFLTDENDLSYIALMVLSGKDVDQAIEEVETLYVTLKDRFSMPSDTAQAAALLLSMSTKPVDQKVESFIGLYEALKVTKHATSKQKAMSVYAAFTDLDVPRKQIVEEIGEAEEWLKHQKGYGLLSSSDVRRIMAATLVLQQYEPQTMTVFQTKATSVVSQLIAQEVIFTIIMMIVISTSVNTTMNSSR